MVFFENDFDNRHLVIVFPQEKQRFGTIFLSAPNPPLPKNKYFYFVVSPSLTETKNLDLLTDLVAMGCFQETFRGKKYVTLLSSMIVFVTRYSTPTNLCTCERSIRHRHPGPYPRIRLALPSSGVDLASIRHRFPDFDPSSMPNRPLRRGRRDGFEGGVQGPCAPNKP